MPFVLDPVPGSGASSPQSASPVRNNHPAGIRSPHHHRPRSISIDTIESTPQQQVVERRLEEMEREIKYAREETERNLRLNKEEIERKMRLDKLEATRKMNQHKEETNRKIEQLKKNAAGKNLTRNGAETEADFYEELVAKQGLVPAPQQEVWGDCQEWPILEDAANSDPLVVPGVTTENSSNRQEGYSSIEEQDVHSIVSKALVALRNHATDTRGNHKWKCHSLPDPNASKTCAFRSRKPYIVNYKVGAKGPLAISAFGHINKRGAGGFTSEEKGHILDMARSFLQNVGVHRPFLIVFLFDGVQWQFFRVSRRRDADLLYQEAPVIEDTASGWGYFIGLLKANMSSLGRLEPSIEGVTLEKPLGRGGSAVAYQGVFQGITPVVVKVFFGTRKSSYRAEKRALVQLNGQNVSGIPWLLGTPRVKNYHKMESGIYKEAIVVSPMGSCYSAVGGNSRVFGRHLRELVETVEIVHSCGFLHRDIKPDNVYRVNDSMLLSDWSEAAQEEYLQPGGGWPGTVGFSVELSRDGSRVLGGKARDLVSLVRTAFCLLFNEFPPWEDKQTAENFWQENITEGTRLSAALEYAEVLDYENLKQCLSSMK